MSVAVVMALAAGVLAAAGIVELASAGPRGGRPVRGARRHAVVGALARLGRRAGAPAAPEDLAWRLAAAGVPPRVTAGDVMAVKGGGALAAVLLVVPLAAMFPGRSGWIAAAALPAAAFLAPDWWLSRRRRRRCAVMALELPDVLDLLRIAVGAGLPVVRALDEVGRRHHGALAGELRSCATAIGLGVPRRGALLALQRRCPLPEVAALVAAVERADRHGAPLADALTALATDARAQRAQAVRDRAARAAPKIQLVIALLLVPAVMLLVAAALLSALT